MPLRVTVWHEYRHEKKSPKVAAIYPKGMHAPIAEYLSKSSDLLVQTATLDEPEAGLPAEKIAATDVFVWWGHGFHDEVSDEVVSRLHKRIVMEGAGLVALHSAHFSKIFKKLMGTSCDLKWRTDPTQRETMWVTRPGHPIISHIDDHLVIEEEEMYGEFFDVPEPECTFLISSFAGGEVFRSGCTWMRGAGKIAYLRPGHETVPSYHNPAILEMIENAVRWAAPTIAKPPTFGKRDLGWVDAE